MDIMDYNGIYLVIYVIEWMVNHFGEVNDDKPSVDGPFSIKIVTQNKTKVDTSRVTTV